MVKILTDSTSDIPQIVAKELGIRIVPLNVQFGEVSYKDGTELTAERFYELLAESTRLPKTSQPSPEDFRSAYAELTADGSEVVSIHLSSGLSGTFNSAIMGAKLLGSNRISHVDTLTASIPVAMLVMRAARMAASGKSREEIVKDLEETKKRVKLYFVLDTLEYVHKGGRIGAASALIGSLLNIKPILTFRNGVTATVEKVRSEARAYARIRELICDFISENPGKTYHIGFCYSSDRSLLDKIVEPFPVNHPARQPEIVAPLGAVVGTYSGPRMVGVGFYAE
jgi:DegV family protein with EDD domain